MMRGVHDIGGNPASTVPTVELPWQKQDEATRNLLGEPRMDLKEFSSTVSNRVCRLVHDCNADLLYLVLSQCPVGTESFGENQLAALGACDGLISLSVVATAT